MKIQLLFIVLQLIVTSYPLLIRNDSYWKKREALLNVEEMSAIGGNLPFQDSEYLTSSILMWHKNKEIEQGFGDPTTFRPAQNFLEARSYIEKSKVFDIIKKMPKGAVLHAHDTAIVSVDWVFKNITYRDNLYICQNASTLSLKFFNKPPTKDCNWKLLKDIRKNATLAKEIDGKIYNKMWMNVTNPNEIYKNGNLAWIKFMDIFNFLAPILTYRPVFEDYIYQGLKELYEDNIIYLELRSIMPTLYELNGKEYDALESMKIHKGIVARFTKDYPDFIGMKIIFAPLKIMSSDKFDNYLTTAMKMKMLYPEVFAGFDLVGQEDKLNPLKIYADKLNAYSDKINMFFHAGETNWYGLSTDENLIDAILLNTKRIGHGYAVLKHPTVLDMMRKKGIAIEVCPISNQVLGLVKDLRNHPANVLFAENFPVVISNDDPGLWGSRALSYDFYEAFMGLMSKKADLRALKQLAMNSITYSSMTNEEKTKAWNIWNKKWTDFNNKISSDHFNNCIVT